MTRFSAIGSALAGSLLLLSGCQAEPGDLCERVRFGWPDSKIAALDPSADVSDSEEGIQVDLELRSDLGPGVVVNFFVAGEDDELAFAGAATSEEDGALAFEGITVPQGNALFIVEARDECGRHRSGRRIFVWDGLGFPTCELSLAKEGARDPDTGVSFLGPEQDQDPSAEGMQVLVTVVAGRPDMEVRLFALDRELDEEQSFFLEAGEDGSIDQLVTLGNGEQALRAVCLWEPQDLKPTTATFEYLVDLGDE